MTSKPIDWIAVLALCIAMLVWGSSFTAFKTAIETMGPMNVIFWRMTVASLVFLYFVKSFFSLKISAKEWKYIAMMVLFEPCLYFLFELHALQYTSAGQAGMITSMMPLMTAFAAGIFLKEVVSKQVITGSVIAVSGAVWLSFSSSDSSHASNPLLGNALEFGAMVCAAGYTIAVRYLSQKFSVIFLLALQSFAGMLFFLPFAWWEYRTTPFAFSMEAALWVIYQGVIVTIGGYGMYNFALGRMEASKAAIYINLIPIFAVVLAYLIRGEVLTLVGIIASMVILTGVFISQISREKLKLLWTGRL